jgi:5-methylthioribose kinase
MKDEWLTDTRRNVSERDFMERVSGFLPDAVPRLLFSSAESGYFVIEYLGEGFSNWKHLLLAGCSAPASGRRAAQILGEIHRRTAGDSEIERRIDTVGNFRQLRI